MSNNPVVVETTLFWPFLTSENKKSKKFQVDISNLSDAAVNAAEMMGLKPRNKGDERGTFLTCKSKYPISVYDTEGNELDGSVVGNGTKAKVALDFYEWQYDGDKGRSPAARKVIITDLVRYESAGGDADVDMDGPAL